MVRTLRKECIAGNRRDGNLSTSVDEWIRVGYWLNDIYSGKPKCRLKTCSSAKSSTTNRTRLVWDQNRAYARRERRLNASATARPEPHIQYEFWHLKLPAWISFCYLSVSDWLRAGRSGDRIPVGARFSTPVQTGPGAHPASCTMGTGSFPGVKSGRGVVWPLNPF